MTTNSVPRSTQSSPLRVTEPQKLNKTSVPASSPEPQTALDKPTSAKPSDTQQPDKNQKPSPRWAIAGCLMLGVGAISLIPIPYQVGGSVQLDWRESARQSVHPPMPALVTEVYVDSGDEVNVGDPLLQLTSLELEREMADVEERLARSQQELAQVQQAQIQAEATLLEAEAQYQAEQERSARLQNRVAQMEQGLLPPEVESLELTRQRLIGQIQEAEQKVQQYTELFQVGAVSQGQLRDQESLYRNLQRDLAVTEEQIELTRRQLQDTAVDELGMTHYREATMIAASTVADSTQQILAHQETIATLNDRLTELTQLQGSLTIHATTDGTVITSDLDLLVGQEFRPDTSLLQIADLNQLTANVEVKEEDLDFVDRNAPVTFRSRQAKLEPYEAYVDDILFNVEADDTQQRRVATVRVVIENEDSRLRPGSSGYAKIFSEWVPLYQRVWREVLKLVPERFL